MKKLLLVIDSQKDFLDGGKLGVTGSTVMMDGLADFINEHGNEYDLAVATVDWHPIAHCSFDVNGGQWPVHCVQHSEGAAIYEPVLNALNKSTKFFSILTKGTDDSHEEYSIFKNVLSKDKLVRMVNLAEIEEIDVAGIALSYCVLDTIKDGKRNLPGINIRLIKDFCPDIGDSTEALKWLENNNVEIV